ncbi:MAG: hypothetical protein K0Q55_466 [Verrucomicrobia bacterium]|jgi:hypothetical protein|nr:hypothetical protein [Verrucomicrobiota bacterium]
MEETKKPNEPQIFLDLVEMLEAAFNSPQPTSHKSSLARAPPVRLNHQTHFAQSLNGHPPVSSELTDT